MKHAPSTTGTSQKPPKNLLLFSDSDIPTGQRTCHPSRFVTLPNCGKRNRPKRGGADFFLNKVTYAAWRSPAKKRAGNRHADFGSFKNPIDLKMESAVSATIAGDGGARDDFGVVSSVEAVLLLTSVAWRKLVITRTMQHGRHTERAGQEPRPEPRWWRGSGCDNRRLNFRPCAGERPREHANN